LQPEALGAQPLDLRLDGAPVADEDAGGAELTDRGHRAFDDDGGTVVTAHGVDRDLHRPTGLPRLRLARGWGGAPLTRFDGADLAALVVATVRTHPMRLLGLPALRAHRPRRRGQLVVGAALAASRTRVTSLG